MKRLMLFIFALIVSACQTTPKVRTKSCQQAQEEIVATQLKAGRVLLQSEVDEAGGHGYAYWDHVSDTASMEFLVPPNYPVLPEYNLTFVEECLVESGVPEIGPAVWKHYTKTIPVVY